MRNHYITISPWAVVALVAIGVFVGFCLFARDVSLIDFLQNSLLAVILALCVVGDVRETPRFGIYTRGFIVWSWDHPSDNSDQAEG